jgi:hypothetical protein
LKYTTEEICKKYDTADGVKQTRLNKIKELFQYTMPDRDNFNKAPADIDGTADANQNYQDNREELFTSAGEQAVNEFVNKMQEVLCPIQQKWIELEAGYLFKENIREAVNKELAKITDIANEFKNVSNFDEAFSEFCYDIFAGTGCLLTMPGTQLNPLRFKAIPLKEYCIEEGVDGNVETVYRKFSMKARKIKYQWGVKEDKEFSGDDKDREVQILECTYKDLDTGAYIYLVLNYGEKKEIFRQEYRTNPFTVLRWNKAAGELYGRGVGLTVLNDIKTLNMIKRYGLMALAYIFPPLLVKEDGLLKDKLDLTPMAMNYVGTAEDLSAVIQPLFDSGYKIDLEQYRTLELQQDIKRNTYGNTLPNEGGKNLTATEVNARLNELRNNLGSVFGRLIRFQTDLVRRIIDVLNVTGILAQNEAGQSFDVTKIDQLTYRIKINSPISRQLKLAEAQDIIAVVRTFLGMDPSGRMLSRIIKTDDALPYVAELLGMPVRFIYTQKETAQIDQRQAMATQAQQEAAVQADIGAANAKALGKAEANIMELAAERQQ